VPAEVAVQAVTGPEGAIGDRVRRERTDGDRQQASNGPKHCRETVPPVLSRRPAQGTRAALDGLDRRAASAAAVAARIDRRHAELELQGGRAQRHAPGDVARLGRRPGPERSRKVATTRRPAKTWITTPIRPLSSKARYLRAVRRQCLPT